MERKGDDDAVMRQKLGEQFLVCLLRRNDRWIISLPCIPGCK